MKRFATSPIREIKLCVHSRKRYDIDMYYIISYDIPAGHQRRWRKLHKLLKEHGHWLQYSTFQVEGNDARMAKLQNGINKIIDFDTDRILIIPLCADCRDKMTTVGEYQLIEKKDFYFF